MNKQEKPLGTFVWRITAAPGSFEGFIYTEMSAGYQLFGISELLLYLSLLTIFVFGWYRKPAKGFTILSVVLVILIILMSLMGVLFSL